MTLTLPPELEQQINNLVLRGAYPNTEAVLVDAVKVLVREQERQRIESLLEANGIDEGRLMQLLQEAEDSGGYTEMTAQDWKDIEREGLAIVNARKSG
jgi:Arc/MetJ-type ribon-helix-helix transcriptional regulator